MTQPTTWTYWNERQPEEPGWYWLHNPHASMEIVNPEIIYVGAHPDGGLALLSAGIEVAYQIEPGLVAWWAGPLEAPLLPLDAPIVIAPPETHCWLLAGVVVTAVAEGGETAITLTCTTPGFVADVRAALAAVNDALQAAAQERRTVTA